MLGPVTKMRTRESRTASMRDSRQLRVGIVGCGAVTELYHVPALLASRDVTIDSVVDPNMDRARAIAARAGSPSILSTHKELVGRVDLAIVATPNAHHERVTSDLLEAAVPVLVEKPMGRTVAECDRMLGAAARTDTLLAVGQDFRYFPVARFARDLFSSGLLGPIRRVDVQQGTGSRWPYASTDALSPESGGGILLDFGVHLLDLLLWWLGDLRPIACRHDAAGGIDTECELDLELVGGAPVHVDLSRTRALRDTTLVQAERGTIELSLFQPTLIRLALSEAGPDLIGSPGDPQFDRSPMRTVFSRQLSDVVHALREHRQPLVNGAAGKRVVALIEGCYTLAQSLRLPWDFPEVYSAIGRSAP
jgi:predicted dehydrogenase